MVGSNLSLRGAYTHSGIFSRKGVARLNENYGLEGSRVPHSAFAEAVWVEKKEKINKTRKDVEL